MKKFLMLFAATAAIFAACDKDEQTPEPTAAIQYSLSDDTTSVDGRASSFELDAYVKFKNLENKTISVKWMRYDEVKPAAWEIATCDNVTCYSPVINSQTITINAMDSFDFKIVFRPQTEAATASAKVRFFDPTDSARTVKVVHFAATAN